MRYKLEFVEYGWIVVDTNIPDGENWSIFGSQYKEKAQEECDRLNKLEESEDKTFTGYLSAILLSLSLSFQIHADDGTFRHVAVGAGSMYACSYLVEKMLHLEKDEAWKSWLFCGTALVASSLLMEGIQAQERGLPLDKGDVANNLAGGVLAVGIRATILEW